MQPPCLWEPALARAGVHQPFCTPHPSAGPLREAGGHRPASPSSPGQASSGRSWAATSRRPHFRPSVSCRRGVLPQERRRRRWPVLVLISQAWSWARPLLPLGPRLLPSSLMRVREPAGRPLPPRCHLALSFPLPRPAAMTQARVCPALPAPAHSHRALSSEGGLNGRARPAPRLGHSQQVL